MLGIIQILLQKVRSRLLTVADKAHDKQKIMQCQILVDFLKDPRYIGFVQRGNYWYPITHTFQFSSSDVFLSKKEFINYLTTPKNGSN